MRSRDRRLADIGREEQAAARVVREAVGPDADPNLGPEAAVWGGEDANGVLAAVRGEDKILLLLHQHTGHPREAWSRMEIPLRPTIDDVQGAVAGMRHVQSPEAAMDRRVIETAWIFVPWQLNIAYVL